ncbi:Reducing polyketide synthase [Colletotrichum sp. SAR11_239]|nr:Reducing polyketide synthase [Colletotrichum sp. SAR11_239]
MPRTVHSKLIGVADAEYDGDAKASQSAPREIIGSLVFSDGTLEEPAVMIDGIVLRELPVGSGYEAVMDSKSDARENRIERTAQFLWKEDIDQDFDLWKYLILSKTTSQLFWNKTDTSSQSLHFGHIPREMERSHRSFQLINSREPYDREV